MTTYETVLERVRANCCDESPIDVDEHAELIAKVTCGGVYQSTFAAQCRWREFELEYDRERQVVTAE